MSKSPVLPLYVRDFLVDTQHFTPAEVGAYIRLLATQWVQPLPNDHGDLARICGMTATAFQRAWTRVLADKFPPVDELYVGNPRLERERTEQEDRRHKRSQSGRHGNDVRWQGPSQTHRKTVANSSLAVAVAVAGTATHHTPWLDEIPDVKHRETVAGVLKAARNPEAVAASIEALHSTMHGNYPWPVIGQALVELLAAGSTFNTNALRAFCRRITAGDPPARPRGKTSTQAENEATLARWGGRIGTDGD